MKTIAEILDGYNLKYGAVTQGEWSHILLAYPYQPFNDLGEGYAFIDAFYLASNYLYHLTKAIKTEMQQQGYVLQEFNLSLKPLGEQCGMGRILNNRLLTSLHYGSKMALQAISVKTNFSKILDDKPQNICEHCRLCDMACPTSALNNGEFCREKCLRNIQDNPLQTSEYMGKRILGCDDCQKVCPYNSQISYVDMPKELKELLDLNNLKCVINGDKLGYEKLSKFIGKNYARAKYIKRILLF